MRLPVAPNAYDRQNEQQARFQVEQEDARNLKSDQDIKLAQGAKIYVRDSGGTYREVTISTGGVVTGTGWTVANERAALGVNPIDNRFINGDNQIDQRNAGAAQTITAGAALAYTIDRWYAYCTGANVTGQRVTGSGADLFRYQFTGAASVTKIGFATRIEARDCVDLAGGSATIAVELANSLLTTVTWTAWYANTTDTFGTLASPTRTQIATGTFTVSSTLTTYTTPISVPAAATTGIEVEFSVAAQTSGTWTIGKRAIVKGSVWPGFCPRFAQQELALCRRYYRKTYALATTPGTLTTVGALLFRNTSTTDIITVEMGEPMRAIPIISLWNTATVATGVWRDDSAAANRTVATASPSESRFGVVVTASVAGNQMSGHWTAEAEL